MSLDYDRVINFDLLERIEKNNREYFLDKYIELFRTISEINSIDKFIKENPSYPGSTDKIIRNEMNMAIGSTLAIEGINLSAEEIEESFHKADTNQLLKRKEQEAENSRKVYHFIIETINISEEQEDSFQFSEGLIKQIHKYFTDDMNYLGNTPGDYRGDYSATFGEPRKESLAKTRVEVEKAMSKFIDWLNGEGNRFLSREPLVKAIMAHFYLTEIHPFADGNGRTARALEALILYLNRKNQYSFWSLANFWSRDRNKYLTMLGQIRATCDPLDFIEWGIEGYLEELTRIKGNVLKKLRQLMLKDYCRFLLNNKRNQKIRINQRIFDVIELLIESGRVPLKEFISSPQIKALYKNVTASTRSRDFGKLYDLKLISYYEDNNASYIEPNFSKLDQVTYDVK